MTNGNKAVAMGSVVGAAAEIVAIVYSVNKKTGFWLGAGYFLLAGAVGYGLGYGVGTIVFKPQASTENK